LIDQVKVKKLYKDWENHFLSKTSQEDFLSIQLRADRLLPHREKPYRPVLCFSWWVEMGLSHLVTSTGLPKAYAEKLKTTGE